jgi:hypothetical protein
MSALDEAGCGTGSFFVMAPFFEVWGHKAGNPQNLLWY